MNLVKKLKVFQRLFLLKIDREKVFADVLDTKEAFKHYKNICLSKNSKFEFFQRFSSKFEISSTLIFMQNRRRKSI